MSDNYSANGIKLYKNKHNVTMITKEAINESSLKFQRLVSIFESEESDSKLKCEFQKITIKYSIYR